MNTTSGDSHGRRLRLIKILEVVTLSIVIVIVWFVFVAIPVLVYYSPSAKTNSVQSEVNLVNNSGACAEPRLYEQTVCFEELREWQQCFSGSQSNQIYLPSSVDQTEAEERASSLLLGLSFLSPSYECVSAIKPFMCLYLFGSCDVNNQPRTVSQADCVRLRDELCTEQWIRGNEILGEGTLPDCSTFGEYDTQCVDTNGTELNQTDSATDTVLSSSPSFLTCGEGFYIENGSACQQLCSSWMEPHGLHSDSIITVASLVNAVLSSVVVIIVTLTLLRKIMFVFPKYYLICMCVSTAFTSLVVLIGVFDRGKLFCSSKGLTESYQMETAYCTINGIAYHYGVIQIALWTLLFTLGFFWGIFFPFHFQKSRSTRRMTYIHVTTLLLGLLLPAVLVAFLLKDGFHIPDTPRRTICIGRNIDAIFYAFLLPFSILSAIITTLLVLIFWKILKEVTLKKVSREKSSSVAGKAEAKILSVICYYILTSCIIIVTFLYSLVTSATNRKIITDYILCQSAGQQANNECGDGPDVQLRVPNSLSTASVLFQSYVPAVVLLFVAKFECNWPRTTKSHSSRLSRTK